MRYNMNDIFNQSKQDAYAANFDGEGYEARLMYGVKIISDLETAEVIILNTNIGGNYYSKLTDSDVALFTENGWRYGVYVISLSSYKKKLDLIEDKIRDELDLGGSNSKINGLKINRDIVLKKYSEVSVKLNKLNNK
tara:strand:- start:21821 stop:22231 length:411 start_codon:yes stop_codon:yes gene_type:complete